MSNPDPHVPPPLPPIAVVMERLSSPPARSSLWQRLAAHFPRTPQYMPADAYESGPEEIRTLRLLAIYLIGTVLFSLVPLAWGEGRWNLAMAPGWARGVLLLAVVQAVYIVWLLNMPDWASLWIVMLVFAASTMAYAMTMAMAIAWPIQRPMLLGMQDVRDTAGKWCGAVVLLMLLATYLCGRLSTLWRRRFVREMTRRRAEVNRNRHL